MWSVVLFSMSTVFLVTLYYKQVMTHCYQIFYLELYECHRNKVFIFSLWQLLVTVVFNLIILFRLDLTLSNLCSDNFNIKCTIVNMLHILYSYFHVNCLLRLFMTFTIMFCWDPRYSLQMPYLRTNKLVETCQIKYRQFIFSYQCILEMRLQSLISLFQEADVIDESLLPKLKVHATTAKNSPIWDQNIFG